ncbi:MAG: L,D-transpeptidase family protein [Alphaproteobacteria bacterium]|nr:L,D-transpeptidase family protein [Alphaproteobacteria bacterium]
MPSNIEEDQVNTSFRAHSDGRLVGEGLAFRCALGREGVTGAEIKREGDGKSPLGAWPMRRVFYRPDRVAPPDTGLETVPLAPHDGWCDAPGDPLYNRPVTLPCPVSHERLWRDDHAYDLIVELGYNDDPPVDGRGSAIFLHLAGPEYSGTAGCVALGEQDLLAMLRLCSCETRLEIAL